ncbi:MAG: polyprenyl synthetase family protein [Kutzneria sp.]|nr:polyprenyl synthetase family protein [Kutzneria sp.]
MQPPHSTLVGPVKGGEGNRQERLGHGSGPPARTLRSRESLTDLLLLLQEEIGAEWPETPDRLGKICRYALRPPGKLLRPLLYLMSAMAVGAEPGTVLTAALGGEYGHVASLIHDDVVDGDDMRRGRRSVPHRYGVGEAIVSGDGLIFASFLGLSRCLDSGVPAERIVHALRLAATTGLDMCRGQLLEAEVGGDLSCGIDTYLRMVTLKTAAALKCACQSGAILGGGSPQQIEALARFGEHIGVAFQIEDDLLPYTSDTFTAGKQANSDVRNRRPTLPILLAYRTASESDRQLIAEVLSGRTSPVTAHERIREVLLRTGAIGEARGIACEHVRHGCEALDALPRTPHRDALTHLATSVINRDR